MGSQSPDELVTAKCARCSTNYTVARKDLRSPNYCNSCR